MSDYKTDAIRNVALLGHGGAGKTMLAEAMLHASGAIAEMGSIQRGTTVCDFDSQEKQHQHSLNSALVSLAHKGKHINLIDTPGYPDLTGRAMTVLPAVETAALVIDAHAGLLLNTKRMFQLARDRRLCTMIVVNKIDTEDVDLQKLLSEIREEFGVECLPINLPTADGSAVIDCFKNASGEQTLLSSVATAHTEIVDQVVEVDEELMELYLEQGEELAPERLHDAFEKALREGHLVPVCFTSAQSGIGVSQLLDLFADLMPNPHEGNPPIFVDGEGDNASPIEITADPDGHIVAHVFKVGIDAFIGKLSVFRVHQGTVTKDSQLLVGDARKPFKVGHLFRLQGKENVEVDSAIPGDICAVAKVDEPYFDAVLHNSHDEDEIHLDPIPLPQPMFGMAIEVSKRGDEQKLSDALHKLSAEDPCFKVEHNAVLNETVVHGLGELHLRMVLEKMADRYNVEVNTRPPRIAYKETVRKQAEGHHRHKKQTGGAGQFGEVFLRLEPLDRGAGFEFIDKVVGGVVPHQFIPAVEKGVRQVIEGGAISGHQMQDVRVTLYDGKHHPVDSKEVAFVAAGKKAFLDAVAKANPVVLEPVVNVDVTAPQDHIGDITGDLSSKRGRISGTKALSGGMVMVSGLVPLSELDSYQSELKSVTGGAGSYTMELSHYDPVPSDIQQSLVAEFNPAMEDE